MKLWFTAAPLGLRTLVVVCVLCLHTTITCAQAPTDPPYDPSTLILRPRSARRLTQEGVAGGSRWRNSTQWMNFWQRFADRDFTFNATARLRGCKLGQLLGESGFRLLNLTANDTSINVRPASYRQAYLKNVTKELEALGYDWELNYYL